MVLGGTIDSHHMVIALVVDGVDRNPADQSPLSAHISLIASSTAWVTDSPIFR